MRNRTELAQHFRDQGFKIGAEIGVFKGEYSKELLEIIPELKLYGVDNWGNNGTTGRGRDDRQKGYLRTLEDLKSYIESGQYIILKKNSMLALADIPNASLDFVFIDAGHDYQSVKDDVTGWTKKVRAGGIVSGHDYYVSKLGQVEVIKAVDEYVAEHKIKLNIINWDRKTRSKNNRVPCWYFIKESNDSR